MDEVSFYPGSAKGTEPEDDPESYSKWFIDNQPNSLKVNGAIMPESIGAKQKLLKMVQDTASMNELKFPMPYLFDNDEQFPMIDY